MVSLLNSFFTSSLQLHQSTAGCVHQQQHMALSTAMTELCTISQRGFLHGKPCCLVPAVFAASRHGSAQLKSKDGGGACTCPGRHLCSQYLSLAKVIA